MEYQIKYSIIDDSDSNDRDVIKLKCIIDGDRKTIFEFSEEVLRDTDCLNIEKDLSATNLYKTIEKFLIRELDSNRLQSRYLIRTNNFSYFCE